MILSLPIHPYLSNALSVRGTIYDMFIPFPTYRYKLE